jgi:hypothetical protein
MIPNFVFTIEAIFYLGAGLITPPSLTIIARAATKLKGVQRPRILTPGLAR